MKHTFLRRAVPAMLSVSLLGVVAPAFAQAVPSPQASRPAASASAGVPTQKTGDNLITNDVNRNFRLIKAPEGFTASGFAMGENNIYGVLFGGDKSSIFKIGDKHKIEIIKNIPFIPRGAPNPYTPQHLPIPITPTVMPNLFHVESRGVYGCIDGGQQPFTFGMIFQLKGGQFSQITTGDIRNRIGCENVVSSGNYLYFSSYDFLNQMSYSLHSYTTIPNQWNSERALTAPEKVDGLSPIATDSNGGIYYQTTDSRGLTTIYYVEPGENDGTPRVIYKSKNGNEMDFPYFLLGQLYIVHQQLSEKPTLTTISRITSEGKIVDIATVPDDCTNIKLISAGGAVYGASSVAHQYGQLFKINGDTITIVYSFSPDGGWHPRPLSLISVGNGVCGVEDAGLDGFGGIFCYDGEHFDQIAAFPKTIGYTFAKMIYGVFNGKIVGTASSLLKKESYIFEIPLQQNSGSH